MFEKAMDTKPLPTANPDPATSDSLQPNPSATPSATIATTREDSETQGALAPPTPPAPPIREFPLRDIFVGPNGLYPGTRWIIYLAMVALVFIVLDWLTQEIRAGHAGSLTGTLVWEITVALAAILPAFVMATLEQHSVGDFGLPVRQAFRRNFWIGALWGMVSLTVLMLALRLAGAFEFGSLALHGSRILKYGCYYAALFLGTAFFEEFLFRGYSQWVLSQGMYFWPAAAVLSVGFGAIHSANPGEAKTGLVAAGLIGFFFCLTLRRTGSLWWAIGFHASWDWGESFLYSVPDSGGMAPGHLLTSSFHGPVWLTGGSVGPEGSLLIFLLLALLWIAFDRTHPHVRYEPK